MAFMTTTDWLAFWDSPHWIYVNARHKDVHYRLIAEEISALVPNRQAHVLDYGSGEALMRISLPWQRVNSSCAKPRPACAQDWNGDLPAIRRSA